MAALCRVCVLQLVRGGSLLVRMMCFLWALPVGVGLGVMVRKVGVGVGEVVPLGLGLRGIVEVALEGGVD